MQSYSAEPKAAASISYLAAATCSFAAGDHGQALLWVERVIALEPRHEEAQALRAAILARMRIEQPREAAALPGNVFDPAQRRWPAAAEQRPTRRWIAMETGYDSNVNSGTDSTQVSIPLLRGAPVDLERVLRILRGQSSYFLGLNAGIDASRAITNATQFRLSGLAAMRVNVEEVEFVPHNYRIAAQVDHIHESLRFALGASFTQQWIARYRLVGVNALSAQIDWLTGAQHTISLFGEYADKHLPQFNDIRTRQVHQGLAWTHIPTRLRVAIYTGQERATGVTRDLDREFDGLSAGWDHRLSQSGRLSLTYLGSRSRYTERSPFFLTMRRETLHELTAEYEHRLRDAWFLTPRIIIQQNQSNVELTRFSRTQLLIELRKEF